MVGIGPITKESGELATEGEEMAEELNKYFSSVFTREDTAICTGSPTHENKIEAD